MVLFFLEPFARSHALREVVRLQIRKIRLSSAKASDRTVTDSNDSCYP